MIKIVLAVLLSSSYLIAQPEWVNKTPSGYLNDYYVGKGASSISKAEAAQIAYADAVILIMRNNSITVNYSMDNKILSSQTHIDNQIKLKIVRKTVEELKVNGVSRTLKGLKEVESYYENNRNRYVAWVLLRLPKNDPINPPSSFAPVWRSALLPGWGQLYKDETFKGTSFMILSLGGFAGGFVLEQLSIDARNKAFSARRQIVRDFYNKESKNYDTYCKVSFIAAASIYIWNVVDAISVKQDNLYVYMEQNGDKCAVKVCMHF